MTRDLATLVGGECSHHCAILASPLAIYKNEAQLLHKMRDREGKRLQPFDIITNSQFHYSVSPSNVLAYFLTHRQMVEKKSSLDEFCFAPRRV